MKPAHVEQPATLTTADENVPIAAVEKVVVGRLKSTGASTAAS